MHPTSLKQDLTPNINKNRLRILNAEIPTNNTCPPRITAVAGTRFCQDSFFNSNRFFYWWKSFTIYWSSVHLLDIAGSNANSLSKIPFCCLTRSLGVVSVPLWLYVLSDQLKIRLGKLLFHQLPQFYIKTFNILIYKKILQPLMHFTPVRNKTFLNFINTSMN